MPLQPLQRRSIVDEATAALRARILHGAWAPGDPVPTEAALTAQLGVSRSTVREALNRLASDGLIAIPHGGTKRVTDYRDHAGLEILADLVVSPEGEIDPLVVRSVVEMRAAIAPDVARLAATHRSEAQARELTDRAAALDPEADLTNLLLATLDWWTALVLASDNLAYRLAYNTLRSTYTESRPVLRELIADELRAVADYRAVSAAVAAQDPDAARQHCTTLVARGTDVLLAALATLQGSAP